jgi:phage major head subunit gpT-like protein
VAGPNLSPSDFARVLEVACKEEFFRIYEDSYYKDAAWKDAVMVTSSDGETEYYGFGGRLPVPGRIDEDARIHYGLDDESYSLTNYTYGLAIDIHRKMVEDDRHNYIRQKFQSAAIGHQIKLQENWGSLINGGTAATCHDGQYFFDEDHPGSADQSNDDQNKPVGTADLATALSNAIDVLKVMRAFTDPKGSPLDIRPTHVVTGAGDTGVAWEMLVNTPGAAGTANAGYNPFYEKLKLIQTPYISSATAWYFLDLGKPVKPFIFQKRIDLEVNVFEPDQHTDNYVTKTYERYRFGYGPWYLAILGDA